MTDTIRNEELALQEESFELVEFTPTINKTTLDVTTLDGELKLANAMVGTSDEQLANAVGKALHLTDYIVHTKQYEEEATGEVIEGVRVLIYDNEGFSYVSSSPVVAENLDVFVGQFGIERFRSGEIKILVKENKSRSGRNYQTISLVA